MEYLLLKNLVDDKQVFDKETKTFFNNLNKRISIFNNKLNKLIIFYPVNMIFGL